MTEQDITEKVKNAWSRETSSVPDEWSETNRARGQCVPTALVLQDYLGGEIVRVEVNFKGKLENHYYNQLEDGRVIDAAASQYPDGYQSIPTTVNLGDSKTIREKLLKSDDVNRRYLLLRQAFERSE